jgi:hypothetical protein
MPRDNEEPNIDDVLDAIQERRIGGWARHRGDATDELDPRDSGD